MTDSISTREAWEAQLASYVEMAEMGAGAAGELSEQLNLRQSGEPPEGVFVPSRRALRTLQVAASKAEQAAHLFESIGRLVTKAAEQL